MNGLVKRLILAALICLPMAVYSTVALQRQLQRKVVVDSHTLPTAIGDWTSEELPLTDAELSMLDAPASCQRLYTDPAGDRVQVLVLQVNDSQNAHDPKLCMSGSGYQVAEDKAVLPPWANGGSSMVSKALFTKGAERVTMYYWLQTSNGTITDMSGGFKLQAVLKALTGTTFRGIAVRVIGLETGPGAATDPAVAAQLWSSISKQVDFDKLVSELN
jgi:EpsI family protein